MSILRGDFVRPNNPDAGLPRGSVWRVICTAGALTLDAENDEARRYRLRGAGLRFHSSNFDKVVLCRGQWVDAREAVCLRYPDSFYDDVVTGRMAGSCASPQNMPKPDDLVPKPESVAARAAEQASRATAEVERLLESARKQEAERKEELRAARAAKAKADKEAAARAKAEEARKALAATLHADRCLGEATLELIAEVSRLNNGGEERTADPSIAAHCDQLQPLARSYGYRIVKPSMIALVVKL